MAVSADQFAECRGDVAVERVRHYVVGFVGIKAGALDPEVRSAGSGTLVDIDGNKGILTASHVIDALKRLSDPGIVRFPTNSLNRQSLRFNFEHCRVAEIKGPTYTEQGPDIAFLRLPPDTLAALGATSSFLNLSARSQEFQVEPSAFVDSGAAFFAATGVVEEWTEDLDPKRPKQKVVGFNAVCAVGQMAVDRHDLPCDIVKLKPTFDEELQEPGSFGGVSGGGIWKFQCDPSREGTPIIKHVLSGVTFFETEHTASGRCLIDHGPKTIYCDLIAKVRSEFGGP